LSFLVGFTTLGPAGATFYAENEKTEAFKHWEIVQKQGAEAFEANEYGKAEKLLREAVEEARKIGPDEIRIARSMGDLGRLLAVRGRFKEAQQLLEEEFYIKDRNISEDVGKLVLDMEDLIRFYLTVGTPSKAKPLTEDLLNFVQGKFREQSVEEEKNAKLAYKEGTPLVGWAGTAAPAVLDPLLEWAISCDKLGDLYRDRGDLVMADRLYKQALDVKATILGKKHLSLANSYDNLAGICLKKGEKKDAESYYKEALDISESVMVPDDPQIYARMNRLATCLVAEGKYGEAEEIYKYAVRRWAGSPSVGQRALYQLGCFYSDRRQFGSAAPLLARALRTAEKVNGAQSINVVPYLRKYGYVLYYCGQKGAGQSLQARANNIAPVVRELNANIKSGTLQAQSLEEPAIGKLPGKKPARQRVTR
jgi:tetratricopeptide (TPR) repeat protein